MGLRWWLAFLPMLLAGCTSPAFPEPSAGADDPQDGVAPPEATAGDGSDIVVAPAPATPPAPAPASVPAPAAAHHRPQDRCVPSEDAPFAFAVRSEAAFHALAGLATCDVQGVEFPAQVAVVVSWGRLPRNGHEVVLEEPRWNATHVVVPLRLRAFGPECDRPPGEPRPSFVALLDGVGGRDVVVEPSREEVACAVEWKDWVTYGNFRIRFNVTESVGAPGDLLRFLMEVVPLEGAQGWLVPSAWVRVDGDDPTSSVRVDGPMVVRLLAVHGQYPRAELTLRSPEGDPLGTTVAGPRLDVAAPSGATTMVGGWERIEDSQSYFRVERMGSTVFFELAHGGCSSQARWDGDPWTWRVGNTTQVVGFFATGAGDLCGPSGTDLLSGRVDDAEGTVVVRLFERHAPSFFSRYGWRVHEGTA